MKESSDQKCNPSKLLLSLKISSYYTHVEFVNKHVVYLSKISALTTQTSGGFLESLEHANRAESTLLTLPLRRTETLFHCTG